MSWPSLSSMLGMSVLVVVAEAAQAQRTRLRIGAFPTALAGFVPEAIAPLRLRHPDVKVTLDEGTDDRDLFCEHFAVAVARDHALAARPEIRLADLAGEDWSVAAFDGLIVRACRAGHARARRHELAAPVLDALAATAAQLTR